MLPGIGQPFPSRDTIVKPTRKASDVFIQWNEQSLLQRVGQTPYRVQAAEVLSNQGATTTGTLGGDQATGAYRVSYMAMVVTAEAASTLELTLSWTYGGLVRSHVFAVLDGSIVGGEQGFVYPVQIDPGTPISYTLTYVGATFRYDATLTAELLQVIS